MVAAMGSATVEDLDDELEIIFIEETFHKSEPIRSKPIQTFIPRVVIKDKKRKTKDVNGVIVKAEPHPKKTTNERFAQMQLNRQQAGVFFETDVVDDEDDDDDQFVDIEDDGFNLEEDVLASTSGLSRSTKGNLSVNLAKKLKKKAIANRLGIAYNPSKRLRGLKGKKEPKQKSWAEKFGRLLAAKKLLYLPLLFRKYNTGPKMTKDELDIEIDLYMAEVQKTKKMRLAYSQITEAVAGPSTTVNNGLTVVKPSLFGGFGGPGWKKKFKTDAKEPDKDALDMEIDAYMSNKGRNKITFNGATKKEKEDKPAKDDLDMDLDQYMASVKKKPIEGVVVNGFH